MKRVFATFDWPPEVTTTLAVPAVPVGVVQVIDVAETTTTFVQAALPTVTVDALPRFVPVIVIVSPPNVVPVAGSTDEIVGVSGDTVITALRDVTLAGLLPDCVCVT